LRRLALALVLLFGFVLGHSADLEVRRARIVPTPEGTFLELDFVYPKGDDPLELGVVMTDRSKGVLEARKGDGWVPVKKIPVPYGRSLFSPRTHYRIRLVGGAYRPGEAVPVTLLFPGGALVTFTARVAGASFPLWPLVAGVGLLLLGALGLIYKRRRAAPRPLPPR